MNISRNRFDSRHARDFCMHKKRDRAARRLRFWVTFWAFAYSQAERRRSAKEQPLAAFTKT